MERNNIKRVPVLRDEKLVGIIPRSNLMGAVASLARDIPDATTDDEHIRQSIVAEIEKSVWCPIGLSVTVRNSIAHLSGLITDERSRQAVIVAAENIHGVVKVHDHLRWMDHETAYN